MPFIPLQLMEDRPCLHPDAICEIIKKFVEKQVIKPCTITDQGLCCFDSLFRGKYIDKALQSQYTSRTKKFLRIRRHYLIAVILTGQDSIARKAIIFMKDPNTSMTVRKREGRGGNRGTIEMYMYIIHVHVLDGIPQCNMFSEEINNIA